MGIDSRLLILDEPTLGLDVIYRTEFYDTLARDYFRDDRSILVTTHQVEEIEDYLTRVLFIQQGKIVLDIASASIGDRFSRLSLEEGASGVLTSLEPLYRRQTPNGVVMIFDHDGRDINKDRDALTQLGSVDTLRKFIVLMQREIWEHTGIWRIPAVALILAILANIAFSGAIDRASVAPGVVARGIIGGSLGLVAAALFIVFMMLAMFYLLDSLHAERKDKSILFWRSLPVSDTLTVLSKMAIAVVVIPVLLWLTLILVQLVSAGLQWIMAGGESNRLIESISPGDSIVGDWLELGAMFVRLTIWSLPLLAWFLFCSSWVSRTPVIMALGIPFAVGLLVRIAGPDLGLFGLFTERLPFSLTVLKTFGIVAFKDFDAIRDRIQHFESTVSFSTWDGFLSHPAVWGGLVVTLILLAATVLIRSRRGS